MINRENYFVRVVWGKLSEWGGGLLKLVWLTENHALNSDATLNYKNMFGPAIRLISKRLQYDKYNHKHYDETKYKILQNKPEIMVKERHQLDHSGPDHRHQHM